MQKYTRSQTARLLRKMTSEVRKTAKTTDKDNIHDLRVSIRRLRACLRLFSGFYPGPARKKLQHEMKSLMHAAGEVRDRDIAMELLADAGIPAGSPAVRRLGEQRTRAAGALQDALKDWKGRGVSRQWRTRLEV